MNVKNYNEEMELPEGISAKREDKHITITGSKGEVKRVLYSPVVGIKVEGNQIKFHVDKMTKREKALVGTYRAHINNMIKGVTEGHVYKLKICSGHFPMNVALNKNQLIIKNYIGEKVPRVLEIRPGADVKIEGDDITVESVDKELAGQTAASIEKLTKRVGFDKRIFQDGIYITVKDGKAIE